MKNSGFIRKARALFLGVVLSVAAAGLGRAQVLYASGYYNGFDGVSTVGADGTVSPFVTQMTSRGLAVDSSGNLFVANLPIGTISEVAPDGEASTVVSGGVYPSGQYYPLSLAFDATGNLYFGGYFNGSSSTLSELTSNGTVKTIAAPGLDDPTGLAFNAASDLFVASTGKILEFTPGGTESVFAYAGVDGGLAINPAGDLFAASDSNGTILEISPTGTVTTFATGLSFPTGLAFNSSGDLFVANTGNSTISEITPDGAVSTYASGISDVEDLAFGPAAAPEPSAWELGLVAGGVLVLLRFKLRKTNRPLP